MELSYKTKKLQNLCEDISFNKELNKLYGSKVAKKLPQRIAELKSFDTLNDVPSARPWRRHKLNGKRKDMFAIIIVDQYRLIFRPMGNNINIEDLNNIKEIEIMEVSKHYER